LRVVVFGGTGMLGSMLSEFLSREHSVIATCRNQAELDLMAQRGAPLTWRIFEVGAPIPEVTDGADVVINCIAVLTHRYDPDSMVDRARLIRVNSEFPHELSAKVRGRLVLLSSDGVFSGTAGPYDESRLPDTTTLYGRSKALGEVPSPNCWTLRCAVFGPEVKKGGNLLQWLLQHPRGATLKGWVNYRMNGVSSLALAKYIAAGLKQPQIPSGVQHVVPSGEYTKRELLVQMAKAYGRTDLNIQPAQRSGPDVDLRVSTVHERENAMLWREAGYAQPPDLQQMIAEMAKSPAKLCKVDG
jgi:dTDP-4-dehydrorhamnose reductase